MAKILMLSHSPTLTTGYGRVIGRVAGAYVEAGHEVSIIGFGYENEPHDLPYAIAPLEGREPEDAIAAAIRAEEPDILFTLGDPWMFELVPELAELARVTWISYFAIDASPIPRQWLNWLACAAFRRLVRRRQPVNVKGTSM